MKKTIVFVTLCIICLFIAVPSFAQDTNNVNNRIVNQYNNPIQGAVIQTLDGKYISQTSKDGTFKCATIMLVNPLSIKYL